MRIKLDENLPYALVRELTAVGHDVDSVKDERLTGESDPEIWAAAQTERRFLITQDLDFSDARKFEPGSHCGILLIRLSNPDREQLNARVASLFRQERVEEWSGCFVVATERKVRILRPARTP